MYPEVKTRITVKCLPRVNILFMLCTGHFTLIKFIFLFIETMVKVNMKIKNGQLNINQNFVISFNSIFISIIQQIDQFQIRVV